MRYADRVASFVRLGELLCQFSLGEKNSLMTKFTEAAEKAVEHNAWFTQEHIDDFMRKTDSRFKIKPIIATRKRIEKQKNFEIK